MGEGEDGGVFVVGVYVDGGGWVEGGVGGVGEEGGEGGVVGGWGEGEGEGVGGGEVWFWGLLF